MTDALQAEVLAGIAIPRPHPHVAVQAEPPHPLVTAAEGLIGKLTAVWWRLEAMLERWRRAMAQEETGFDPRVTPPDVPIPKVSPDKVNVSGHGHFGGDWRRRRYAIIDTLLIAGIIALVSTSIHLSKLTTRLEANDAGQEKLYDERFGQIRRDNDRQDAEIRGLDERLDRIDQQRRVANRHNDDQ